MGRCPHDSLSLSRSSPPQAHPPPCPVHPHHTKDNGKEGRAPQGASCARAALPTRAVLPPPTSSSNPTPHTHIPPRTHRPARPRRRDHHQHPHDHHGGRRHPPKEHNIPQKSTTAVAAATQNQKERNDEPTNRKQCHAFFCFACFLFSFWGGKLWECIGLVLKRALLLFYLWYAAKWTGCEVCDGVFWFWMV